MARIEDIAERYGRHIATPWQRTVAGAQRVVMVVYDKELERTLRARVLAFETATREAGHDWRQIDLSATFAEWMAADDYRDEYFQSPEDLQLKLEAEFPEFVAERLRTKLQKSDVTPDTVVAVLGVGALFGFARISQVFRTCAIYARPAGSRFVARHRSHLDGSIPPAHAASAVAQGRTS